MSPLRKLWWGQYPLPIAFWLFYAIGFFVVLIAAGVMLFISRHLHMGTVGFIVGFVLLWTYWFIASVGVWRSAQSNIASAVWLTKVWGVAARGIVILFVIRAIWSLSNGGALSLMERMTARMDF